MKCKEDLSVPDAFSRHFAVIFTMWVYKRVKVSWWIKMSQHHIYTYHPTCGSRALVQEFPQNNRSSTWIMGFWQNPWERILQQSRFQYWGSETNLDPTYCLVYTYECWYIIHQSVKFGMGSLKMVTHQNLQCLHITHNHWLSRCSRKYQA